MKKLLLLFILPVFCYGQGDQTIINVPINSAGGTEKAILHLPDDYGKTTTNYPIMVFLHGVGEGGANPAAIYNSSSAGGPAYFIAQGKFPTSFVNPADGKSYKFIVVSPQANNGWSTYAAQLEYVLTYLLKTYRVDQTRLYLTGLSAGGEGICEYVGKLDGNSVKVPATHPIAAFIPMSAVMAANNSLLCADTIVADAVHVWGFGSPTDTHGQNTLTLVGWYVNGLKKGWGDTTSYSGGHCCWGQFYDPNFKKNGKNIYQWALQYTHGATAPVVSVPVANAGSNQTITLPTNQVTLSGTASTVTNGTISKYAWSQQSGPSTATLTAAAAATTTATGLTKAGAYVFKLTITDNTGNTSAATVQETVNAAAPSPTVPVANAGSNQTITLPTNQATLSGTASTVTNGTISKYAWSQQSGPSTATLTAAAAATTTVTGLTVAGTYVFKLTITDNKANINSATTQISLNTVTSAPSACGGQRRPLNISANDQGKWISPSNFTVKPGDTIVVSSKYRWSYLSGDGLHGTASCPIVIMNDTGQVELTAGIAFSNSTHVHITGTGSVKHFYGFYVHSYDSIPLLSRGASLQFSDRSAFCEIDHIDEYMKTYCMWLKEEAQCADSLRYPNWRLDNFSIHDIRAKNITQDGFYLGSTSPNGDRTVSCNGQNILPIPMRLSNIHIYNIILDSVGRTGIQLSGADSGDNQIYNCHVTRTGFEFNPQQGSGIILGGYTTAYVHDNYIRNTYQHGISLLGAGLMRVENNDIDSSGYLEGIANVNFSNIAADTRLTTNQGATPPINSTVYIKNNKLGVSTNRTGTKTAYRSIDIGYSYLNLPTWTNNNIICGNVLQDGKTAAEFRIDSHIGYSSNCGADSVPSSALPIPGKIEAAGYSGMSGVATQTTTDAGGGLNVGWIGQRDYMDYTVNVATAGAYTVGFRVATANANAGFQLLSASGAVLATVTTNSTGGFQTWKTLSATVTLPAGNQTLRVYSSGSSEWNLNWMQFTNGSSAAAIQTAEVSATGSQKLLTDSTADASGAASSFVLYPNPVQSGFTIQLNNGYMGNMRVQIVDVTGVIRQTYSYNKTQASMQLNLSAGNLPAGTYFVRVQIGALSEIKKIVKL